MCWHCARQCSWSCICIMLHVSLVLVRQGLQATTGQVFPQNSKTVAATLPLHLPSLRWHTLLLVWYSLVFIKLAFVLQLWESTSNKECWYCFSFCTSDSAHFCSSGRLSVVLVLFSLVHIRFSPLLQLWESTSNKECWYCFSFCTSDSYLLYRFL
jgi:hypothetical protein